MIARSSQRSSNASARAHLLRRMAGLPLLWLTLCAILLPNSLQAQETTETPEAEEPPRVLIVERDALVIQKLDPKQDLYALRRAPALVQGLRKHLVQQKDSLRFVSAAALQRSIDSTPLYQNMLSLARGTLELGLRRYRELDSKRAIGDFETALKQYRTVHIDFTRPKEVAELLMYLSLSYLEQEKEWDSSLNYMKQMIRLDPERLLRPGFYPDTTVDFFRSAQKQLVTELRDSAPPSDEAQRLAKIGGARYVLYIYALPDRELQNSRVIFQVFDATDKRFVHRDELHLQKLEPRALAEAANRLGSRWSECLREPARTNNNRSYLPGEANTPFALHLGGNYGTFLQFPNVSELFNVAGVSIGGQFELTPEFSFDAVFQILESFRDYDGALADSTVTTLRFMLGGTLALQLGDFELGARIAFELASLSDFETSPSLECRFGDGIEGLCGDIDKRVHREYGLLLGVNIAPHISYEINRSFELYSNISLSYYVYPLATQELNFPLFTEVGLLYRF